MTNRAKLEAKKNHNGTLLWMSSQGAVVNAVHACVTVYLGSSLGLLLQSLVVALQLHKLSS